MTVLVSVGDRDTARRWSCLSPPAWWPLKSLRNEHAAAPAASPSPIAGPSLPAGATPRYYVTESWVKDAKGKKGIDLAWVAADSTTGKRIGYVPLPSPQPMLGEPIAAAADDRTFVTAEAVTRQTVVKATGHGTSSVRGLPILESLKWYLLRIFPGSADPVRVTTLPIQHTAAYGDVNGMALSGDGSELAVEFRTSKTVTLRVYSVATGRPLHTWSATFQAPAAEMISVTDLSWVGDGTVGFAVSYDTGVSEEVRTLSISAPGTGLLADSRVVWSQDAPPPPHDKDSEGTPQACDTPFLTGNGQAVVCATSTYSASAKRLSAVWLAYPVAAPTRARVLGSVLQPKDVSSLNPPTGVEWTNASGTEVIGEWNPTVITFPGGDKTWTTSNYVGIVGGGTVRRFTAITDPDPSAAW
ncbi:MAG: hypothetical protein JWM19_6886 [Actinomycetia bacterium]|nr:hypothetical protein [Actinomycetes bacterium]